MRAAPPLGRAAGIHAAALIRERFWGSLKPRGRLSGRPVVEEGQGLAELGPGLPEMLRVPQGRFRGCAPWRVNVAGDPSRCYGLPHQWQG